MLSPGHTSHLRHPRSWDLPLFLAAYTAVMMAFCMIARGWGPLHGDMTEAWAWGKEFQLGYDKHPMIFAWIAGAWFELMPRTNWSFYLLSVANAGIGLAGVWMLARLFLTLNGRLIAVLFLVLTPSFTLWAFKFNANSVLLSSWPWATYFLVQSLRTRRPTFAVLAGVAGAIAFLGKYYSIILLATLFIAALLHPDRNRYFRSPAPYITLATGGALIAPHLWWLSQSDYTTLSYAFSKTQYSTAETQERAVSAVIEGYLCLGLAAAALALAFGRQSWQFLERALKATFKPDTAWLIWLAHGPLILTIAAYLLTNVRITVSHLMPAFFAMPIAFLASSGALVRYHAVRRLAFGVAAVWLVMIAGSPLFASFTFARANDDSVEPRRELAIASTWIWHQLFDRPLRYVAGTAPLATAATFYSTDAPSYFMLENPSLSPWVKSEQVKEAGLLILCRTADAECTARAAQVIADRPYRVTREFSTSYGGSKSPARAFTIFMLPPSDMDFLD